MTHQESLEHALYTQAKNAEAQRKKQTQVVSRMQNELMELRRRNAKMLKVREGHRDNFLGWIKFVFVDPRLCV